MNDSKTPNLDKLNVDMQWVPPIPLLEYNVPPFPVEAFPTWLEDFIKAEAEATQTPLDLAGMLVLSALSTACAQKVRIRLWDGYEEPLNLYLAVVLGPGNRKSSVFSHVIRPIQEFEEYQVEAQGPNVQQLRIKKQIKERELEQALKEVSSPSSRISPDDVGRISSELRAIIVPALPRLFADDCTPEKLGDLLAEQDGRLAFLSPEGGIFEMIGGRYSNGVANLDIYLKAHSGDEIRIDRKSQGGQPVFIKQPALTFGLAIQPNVLQCLANQPSFKGRGLLGRFNYSLPQSPLGSRKIEVLPVSPIIMGIYRINMGKLLALPWSLTMSGGKGAHCLTLDDWAKQAIVSYAKELEPKLGEDGELGFLQDWAGKNTGTVGRVAGLLHLAHRVDSATPWDTSVSLKIVEGATRLGKYFIPHAKAAYLQMDADPNLSGAKRVLNCLRKNAKPTLSTQEIWQSTKGYFRKMEGLQVALKILEGHNYIRVLPNQEPNRPGKKAAPIYEINPLWSPCNSYNPSNSLTKGNSSISSNSSPGECDG